MGKNQNSVVVLWIRLKFWCMIPMGVKYNHKKFEQETRRWRPGTGFTSGGPQFQKLQFRAKNSRFWAKKALEHMQNGQTKGDGGYTLCAASLPRVNELFATHDMSLKRPKKAPRSSKCRQPQTNNRPYIWLHGSKCDSEGTYSTHNPPLFVVSTPQNCPNGRLDPHSYAH